jgi:hypothetical protein
MCPVRSDASWLRGFAEVVVGQALPDEVQTEEINASLKTTKNTKYKMTFSCVSRLSWFKFLRRLRQAEPDLRRFEKPHANTSFTSAESRA